MDSLELYSILASLARACFFKAFKAYRNEEATNDDEEDVQDSIAKEITSTVKKSAGGTSRSRPVEADSVTEQMPAPTCRRKV
jgi:hypothetical protein